MNNWTCRRCGEAVNYELFICGCLTGPSPWEPVVEKKESSMNIKDMVRDGKKVTFVQYREGEFIYRTECGFEFPVPLNDLGKATLLAEDKAMLFMRYIRKHIQTIEEIRTNM